MQNKKFSICFIKISAFMLAFLLFAGQANAQDDLKNRRFEIVLNITNAISRFSGNGVKNINEDPYLLALKWRDKNNKHALRVGFNQSYTSQTTQLFPGDRRSNDFYFAPLVGFEIRRHIDNHFMFFYGLDARAGFRNGSVEIRDNNGQPTQVISSNETGYGAGPFCGFVWKINPRIYLFTEANLYASYNTIHRNLDDGFSKTELENSSKLVFAPVIPTSIFVSINF
jgi:hypothetical protein